MKIFTSLNIRIFLIIFMVFVFVSALYALNKVLLSEVEITIVPSVISSADKKTSLFSTTSFFVLPEPKPEITYIPVEKVKRGIVQTVDINNNSFTIKVGSDLILVENGTVTAYYLGEEKMTDIRDIHANMKVYVFGYLGSGTPVISASKIIISNKAKIQKKPQSQFWFMNFI